MNERVPNPGNASPPYEVKALANLLLDWAECDGIPVTPMKLQKLLYFCHADFLILKSHPLIMQDFEAWDYGPVSPSVFEEFREFSKVPIGSRAFRFDPILGKRILAECNVDEDTRTTLRALYNFYKNATATFLSELSHEPFGPWDNARRLFAEGRNMDRRMSNELINSYHRTARSS